MKSKVATERLDVQAAVETMSGQVLDDVRFEALLVERYADLLRLAFLVLHDRAEAEDVTQIAPERAWRSRAQLRSGQGSVFWLRRIVVREALRARSSPWRRLISTLHIVEADPSGGQGEHIDRLDLVRAFEHLPRDQSAVVVLHHCLAYPVADVAAMLGVPIETVRSRLRLAMRRLREELQDG